MTLSKGKNLSQNFTISAGNFIHRLHQALETRVNIIGLAENIVSLWPSIKFLSLSFTSPYTFTLNQTRILFMVLFFKYKDADENMSRNAR